MPYPQGYWDSSTGLHYDSNTWHFFTMWGLASYIVALVQADKLGIINTQYPFDLRAQKILNFLSSETLTSNGVPYVVYDATTGSPATNLMTSPTNTADYGRLLIALYLLKQRALARGSPSMASAVDQAVNRVNTTILLPRGSAAYDVYSYYYYQGFVLWGRNDIDMSWVNRTSQNGPWADSSKLFGVGQVPLTSIASEPFLNFIFELNPSRAFTDMTRRIYEVQEARWRQTGKLTAWSEGALNGDPYFVYEAIVLPPSNYWVIQGPDQKAFLPQQGSLPVVFTKTALGMHALFNTNYTSMLAQQLIQHNPPLYGSTGFLEGVSESSVVDSALDVQTQDSVISAAQYAVSHSSQSTPTTTSLLTSSSTNPISETSIPVAQAMFLILAVTALLVVIRWRRRKPLV